jgi:hypothetical protein
VFDRPLAGRHLFEAVIRENLDLGRPEKVSLIFNRRITQRTPGTFHTRVITQGVIPSLHVSYKSSKVKQYFKEGRALRTETTINNTHDFGIGRNLNNLPALRAIGFAANRRLLEVETIAQDCLLAEGMFDQVTQPQGVAGQRAAGLHFDDPCVFRAKADTDSTARRTRIPREGGHQFHAKADADATRRRPPLAVAASAPR